MTAAYTIDVSSDILRFSAAGDWRARFMSAVDDDLRAFESDSVGRDLVIDVSKLEKLDTAGAMVLQRVMHACTARTEISGFEGASPEHEALLENVRPHLAPCIVEPERRNAFVMMTERLGEGATAAYIAAIHILNFIGLVLATAGRAFADPRRFRIASTVNHMEEAGLDAVPIAGMMAFLIGAVVAYMGAKTLEVFNAEIFTVEMVGLAVLREFGVLLSAILVAGRSGSAFTAQIGSMKIREEIDAMRTLGLDPIEVLVLPRAVALIIMMPVLAFLSAMLGLIGGGLVCATALDISPALFISRMQETVGMNNFWAGLIKAPFFAFIIAVIGCFQGMQVEGSAESVGQRTTLSVVQSLFLVIVLDAFFAMFFLEIDF
ncbi:MAG: ABC transporter permease [Pseudomonadota bacterium]